MPHSTPSAAPCHPELLAIVLVIKVIAWIGFIPVFHPSIRNMPLPRSSQPLLQDFYLCLADKYHSASNQAACGLWPLQIPNNRHWLPHICQYKRPSDLPYSPAFRLHTTASCRRTVWPLPLCQPHCCPF